LLYQSDEKRLETLIGEPDDDIFIETLQEWEGRPINLKLRDGLKISVVVVSNCSTARHLLLVGHMQDHLPLRALIIPHREIEVAAID